MRGWIAGAGVAVMLLSGTGCSSGPSRTEFVDQLMKVNITPDITPEQSTKLRNVWGCVYDHLDDDSIEERVMKLEQGDRLATQDSAALSQIIANQCKAEMEAGATPETSTPETSTPAGTTTVPAFSVP